MRVLTYYTVGQLRHNSRLHVTGTYDRLLRPPRTLPHYLYPKRQPFSLFIFQLNIMHNHHHLTTAHGLSHTQRQRPSTTTYHVPQPHTSMTTPPVLPPTLTIDNLRPQPTDHINEWCRGKVASQCNLWF